MRGITKHRVQKQIEMLQMQNVVYIVSPSFYQIEYAVSPRTTSTHPREITKLSKCIENEA